MVSFDLVELQRKTMMQQILGFGNSLH